MADEKLTEGIAAFKGGNKTAAKQILSEVIRAEPTNETAWLWLSACVDTIGQKTYCLKRALAINPGNLDARQALEQLEQQERVERPPLPSLEEMGTVPKVRPPTFDTTPGSGSERKAPIKSASPAPTLREKTTSLAHKPKLASSVKKSNSFTATWIALSVTVGFVCVAVSLIAVALTRNWITDKATPVAVIVMGATASQVETVVPTQHNTPLPVTDTLLKPPASPAPVIPSNTSTRTPRPTNTPTPTSTRQPTDTPLPTETPVPPTATPKPIGTLRVDQWELVITRVLADPGKDISRQNVVIFAMVTNHGSQGTFSPNYTIELLDSKGRRYTDSLPATFSARDKYGVDTFAGASMSPESTELVLIAYEAPAGEKTFTIVPGDLVGSWSGDLTFVLP